MSERNEAPTVFKLNNVAMLLNKKQKASTAYKKVYFANTM